MKFTESLKSSFGRRKLSKEIEPVRIRKGFNFHSAQSVVLIYVDSDESYFKRLKKYAAYLKANFNIKKVNLLGYVDHPEKYIPIWQQRALEIDFFCKSDLNWHLRPVKQVKKFLEEEYDILIDFSEGECVPLNFLLKESKAHMKVGLKGSTAEKFCDFIIDLGDDVDTARFVEQLNLYLSNPQIK